MKDVISYRTDELDELKKIAKIRNVSLSTITGEIIQDYLRKHNLRKKYDMFIDCKKFVSTAFDCLEPPVFEKIVEIGTNEYLRGLKMTMNDFSLENILSSFREWIEINNLKLSEFDENERYRWICETNMGRNYNEITVKIFKKILENFSFRTNVSSFSDEDFELVFAKN